MILVVILNWVMNLKFSGFDVTAALVQTDANIINGTDPVAGVSDDDDETEAYVGIHRSFDIMKWGSGS